MTTTTRHGTIAYYRDRTATLANENAELRTAVQDASTHAAMWHRRACIATERAEQAERERDGESTRADRLSADLAHLTKRHGAQTTALCRAREDLAEEARTVEILRDEMGKVKSDYVRCRIRCSELAGQIMDAQVLVGKAQTEAADIIADLSTARLHLRILAAASVASVLALSIALVLYA
ncbi:MAG: hypothetical protein ACO3GM_03640 [Candidatus Limnocylindrus sp.]